MPPRTAPLRSALVTGALFGSLFAGGFLGAYVYSHEPARDVLDVVVSGDSAAGGVRTVNGTIAGIEGDRVTLTTAAGQVVVTLPAGVPVDDLLRAPDGLPGGARVNVGVQSTQYGLVLTGLVAVEGTP
jgi:hypothetical protein